MLTATLLAEDLHDLIADLCDDDVPHVTAFGTQSLDVCSNRRSHGRVIADRRLPKWRANPRP